MSVIEFTKEDLEQAMGTEVYLGPNATWNPRLEAIRVAHRYGLRQDELFSRSRIGILPMARKELWQALRNHGWSYPAIGHFTGHHHTTVLYALDVDTRLDKEDRRKARKAAKVGTSAKA